MKTSVDEELLIAGLDDVVQAAEVVWVVGSTEHDDEDDSPDLVDSKELRSDVADVVERLVTAGLMEVGDIGNADDGRIDVVAWSSTASELRERILNLLEDLERLPGLWELFWLQNTPAGDAVARAAMERVRSSSRPDAPPGRGSA